jgi:hypothetical protein
MSIFFNKNDSGVKHNISILIYLEATKNDRLSVTTNCCINFIICITTETISCVQNIIIKLVANVQGTYVAYILINK